MSTVLPAAWALQVGLYTHLSAATTLHSLIGNPARLYDGVPADAIFPFVTIGEAVARDYEGVDGAQLHEIRLHSYSRWGGRQEVKRLQDLLYTLLHDEIFPLDGHRVAQCRFVFADLFRQPDGETFHGVSRFRIITEPSGGGA